MSEPITTLLADLVRAYEREVNPASSWKDTALTKDEFDTATKEYRAAKEWLLTRCSGDESTNAKLTAALENIQQQAMDHPCFYVGAFERRDITELCKIGGDICDWTMIAIVAADALEHK